VRRSALILLAFALLVAGALLVHREPRGSSPRRPPPREPAVEPLPPEPEPVATTPASAALPTASPSPAAARPVRPVERPPAGPAAGDAIVRGTVRILGEPPPRKKYKLAADPKCEMLHPGGLLSDSIVVDRQGGVRWAFVYIAQGINNQAPRRPLPPALLDQVGCMYEPHVLGVEVDQPLNIFNNDQLLHNVHLLPHGNLEINFGLPSFGNYRTVRFDTPEVMIRIACDLHPWMKAWVGVLNHPYFSVTGESGSYGIPNLPPGRYTLKVWHEVYATVTREVDVPPGADLVLDFVLDARKQ
jgi:hypothetical protein